MVYDPSVIENLVKTIKILLQTNKQCSAYIANAIRNQSTYEQFREALSIRFKFLEHRILLLFLLFSSIISRYSFC